MTNRLIVGVVIRHHGLRWPVSRRLGTVLAGETIRDVRRRGKYLAFDCGKGSLILHLGMSGSLRVVARDESPGPYDHFDLAVGEAVLRLRDPRRFGAVLWQPGEAERHPLLAGLGIEPLSDAFTGDALHRLTRGRRQAIKLVLMNAALVVGIGNIYANESLFRARIHPATPARRLSRDRCERLAGAVRETLEAAIAAGGSTLRDFVQSDGNPGYFQQQYLVYDREGLSCRMCGTPIHRRVHGQRSTYFCPRCQHG